MPVLRRLFVVIFLLFVLPSLFADDQARLMVHLLDYISVDYSTAVNKGQVANDAEYAEMQEFAATLKSLDSELPGDFKADLDLLYALIEQKAEPRKVSSVCTSLKHRIISTFELAISPTHWPNLSEGAALYALHCTPCHGQSGSGNGPLSAGLDPKPSNFLDSTKAFQLSPFQAFNTIRLGLDGTAMRPFNELTDEEAWDLAFYLTSLYYQGNPKPTGDLQPIPNTANLNLLSSANNYDLAKHFSIPVSHPWISSIRLKPGILIKDETGQYFALARKQLNSAERLFLSGQKKAARAAALSAYLDGIEPLEAKLRANDNELTIEIENLLSSVRQGIDQGIPAEDLSIRVNSSLQAIDKGEELLTNQEYSQGLAFLLSSSIILREGLEAFLVILTFLSIVRAMKLPKAARYVHFGWLLAIASGLVLYFLAERLFRIGGAQREIMEGLIALFAVGVLLYVGFWMHSKSAAGKWQAYIKNKIHHVAKKKNLIGLSFLSFLVVFREAFESVLFLSALNIEVGEENQNAFLGGMIAAFALLFGLAIAIIRYAKRIPIPKLFRYSSILIALLAFVLTGKGIHAMQEAGSLSISPLWWSLRIEWLGYYPSMETTAGQLLIVILVIALYRIGNPNKQRTKKIMSPQTF